MLLRALAAGLIAAAGLVAAMMLGAPPFAALIALLAGLGFTLLQSGPDEAKPLAPGSEDEAMAALPDLAELMRAVDEPMLIVRDRRVLAGNDAAMALLGSHIVGADVRLALRHPAAAERLLAPPQPGEAARVELEGLGEGAQPWAMTVTDLADGSRLVRLSDVGETRAAEQMRVDFVANASHELRTPLASLLGFIETLDDVRTGSNAGKRARILNIMADEAKRMQRLVDDLMSLSRIEAEQYRAPADAIDLAALVDEAVAGMTLRAEGRDLIVEKRATSSMIIGDRPQLAQLLANLLANALQYGRAGTPVRVRLEDGDEWLRLQVIDEGEGIAPEHLPRLTERFYRVDAGRSRAAGGTGLGLAIVKHIVQRHRGRLDIRSVRGEGTTVTVDLPRVDRSGA